MKVRLSVIFPVRDQLKSFARALEAALSSLESFSLPWEMIVVDDASREDVRGSLQGRKIHLLQNPVRCGFGISTNRAMRAARGEFCCLLNSDMYVESDFFPGAIEFFRDPQIIAVSGAIREPDGTDAGLKTFQWGKFGPGFRFAAAKPRESLSPIPYANGGGSFFRREPFLELGGFDDLYSPFYWEDSDFGLRAWKQGWTCYHAPQLKLTHDRGTSVRSEKPIFVRRIRQRNRHLFHWLNFTDLPMSRLLRKYVLPEAMQHLRSTKIRRLSWLVRELGQLGRIQRERTARGRVGISDAALIRLWEAAA